MKCTNCQGEWTPPANQTLSKCPFCQTDILQMLNEQTEILSTEVILSNMLQAYGSDLLQNQQRLAAMISDLFVHDHGTKRLLLLSVSENIPTQLLAIQQKDTAERTTHIFAIKHRLAEEAFLKEDVVKQILEIWTNAMGWDIETTDETVTDIDGNVYKTVRIGNQIWMAENLKVSKYRNGDLIPNIQNGDEWKNSETGAWCNYDNKISNDHIYGKLYNWYALDCKRGLAPKGWHIPSYEEWTILIEFLGGNKVAGGKLKEVRIEHWHRPNYGATNKSGFSALPCGYYDDRFFGLGDYCFWWSSSEFNAQYDVWLRFLSYDEIYVKEGDCDKWCGLSVRCLKNTEPDTIADIDGNEYKTVRIGNQLWMTENLKVNRYRNGDLIPNIQNDEEWNNSETGAWCNYDNNPAYDPEMGKLYNWFAVNDERGLAPEGWHVPSDEEWRILTEFLGGYEVAGDKLKEAEHLEEPNIGATNESGFSALLGGKRPFNNIDCEGIWWSTSQKNKMYDAWCRMLDHYTSNIGSSCSSMWSGCSVRCLKD